MRLLQIQAICIQQEVVHADDQNAIVGIPGSRVVLDNDNLFKGIINAEQRIGFLLHFRIIGDGKCRLDIVALGPFVAHRV